MSRLPKTAILGTNPCRIKYMGQEIVIYRQDLMGKMMRNLVGVKPDLESADLKRYVSLLFKGMFIRSSTGLIASSNNLGSSSFVSAFIDRPDYLMGV
jgi:hypothetical protein